MSKLIEIKEIERLYKKGKSSAEIGSVMGISWRRVIYLMEKNNLKRRSRSEATYRKLNPHGDPFNVKKNLTRDEQRLKNLALGLYMGEGTKSNSISVRLSNSDPNLVNIFLKFLTDICGVRTQKIKLWITLHSDIPPKQAERFWSQKLSTPLSQFSKSVIINNRGNGIYKKKSLYGTATICVHNMKLRKLLQGWIKKSIGNYAHVVQPRM